jgi:hypothetical protein
MNSSYFSDLYMTARHKKQESSRKEGKRAAMVVNWQMKKMRIIFGVICARTAAVAATRVNDTTHPLAHRVHEP